MKTVQKKICLLGEFAVGKTSLVRQFVEGQFNDRYLSTIGVKISRKVVEREYGHLNFLLWDLAGGDNYVKQAASYLKGASGALIVCDLTRAETLAGLFRYSEQLYAVNKDAKIIIAGNKIDLVEERMIEDSDLQDVASKLNAHYFCTSAKTGEQVEEAFTKMAELLEEDALK
jgi:small GTP-binding protein